MNGGARPGVVEALVVALGAAALVAALRGLPAGIALAVAGLAVVVVVVVVVAVPAAARGRGTDPGEPARRAGDDPRLLAAAATATASRALPWVLAVTSLVLVGVVAAGGRVGRGAGLLAWAALAVLLGRAVVGVARGHGRAFGDELTDPLTGLASREAISEALAAEAAGSVRPRDEPRDADEVALLLTDIDRFDEINMALGREAGDAVLTEVGARLQAVLRPPQLLARLGGDEFAVLLPGAGPEPATRVATALREALVEPLDVAGVRLSVQATVGVATCAPPRGRPEDLLRQADAAVHRAKATSSGIAVYDAERDGADPGPLHRAGELRSAVEQGDLVVHLQPQVELATGAVAGCEALVRWRHPHDGVLLPDAFLPVAAATGLLRPVAAVVLDRALEACATWWQRSPVAVSVNLTAGDLLDPGLTERITATLARHGLPAAALRVELTEEALVADAAATARLLHAWRELGVAVALDDFGTGYSSLAYLRDLPFDELKLDRVFGGDVRRRRTATIVGHTVALAHALGMRVVAEGVEDGPCARALAGLGCDVGQGLLFGAAMPPADFVALLERSG